MILNISGYDVLIDDEDYNKIKNYKWHIRYCNESNRYDIYAYKYNKAFRLYRIIMKENNSKIEIDHINHNTLDNQKCNLRKCTHQENIFNQRINKNNTSGYRGVSWNKYHKKWDANIKLNYKKIYLGHFKNKEDAKEKYNQKAIELFGEFAYLN
jgi:hypothetical protein